MAETLDKVVNFYDNFMISLKQRKEVKSPTYTADQLVKEATTDLVKNGVGGKSTLTYLTKLHELNDKLHKVRTVLDSEFML